MMKKSIFAVLAVMLSGCAHVNESCPVAEEIPEEPLSITEGVHSIACGGVCRDMEELPPPCECRIGLENVTEPPKYPLGVITCLNECTYCDWHFICTPHEVTREDRFKSPDFTPDIILE